MLVGVTLLVLISGCGEPVDDDRERPSLTVPEPNRDAQPGGLFHDFFSDGKFDAAGHPIGAQVFDGADGCTSEIGAIGDTGIAASAAYWILSQCNEITLERTAMVGSIGVACVVPKQVERDEHGYVHVDIVSTNAPNKWPDPTTESGKAKIVERLDAIEAQFLADVARGRGVSVDTVKEKFGQGDVFLGADAIKRGMADRIESYEATFTRLARMVATQRRAKALRG